MNISCARRHHFARIMIGLCATLIAILWYGPVNAQDDQAKEIENYYTNWQGVKAPELGQGILDRTIGPAVNLESLRGKRVLLISFDSGDFVRGPDADELLKTLGSIEKARGKLGPDELAVIGFTRGPMFVWPGAHKPKDEVGKLTNFPVINIVNREFNEPYNLLLSPSAILIDRQGILRAFYLHPPTEEEVLEAVTLEDWEKPIQSEPVEDPWNGKEPPKPLSQLVKAWSIPVERIQGLTSGDWDLDGNQDVLAVRKDELLVLDPKCGAIRKAISILGLGLETKPLTFFSIPFTFPDHPPIDLNWCEIQPGRSAFFQQRGGWPHELSLMTQDGSLLWQFRSDSGIDDAAFADLRGEGTRQVLIGLNGFGLCVLDNGGNLLWKNRNTGNTWTVCGLNATERQQGLVLCAGNEGIYVFDPDGKQLRVFKIPSVYFAAADSNNDGRRQILAVQRAVAGKIAYVKAMDMDGNSLWRYPIDAELKRPVMSKGSSLSTSMAMARKNGSSQHMKANL